MAEVDCIGDTEPARQLKGPNGLNEIKGLKGPALHAWGGVAVDLMQAVPVEAADTGWLKQAFGSFATGVTVVTARLGARDHAMTANAFCSVSLDPPLVLVCVEKQARMHDFILGSGAFVVNILGDEQEGLSRHFASRDRPIEGEFAGVPSLRGRTGAPILAGTCAFVECTLHRSCDGGDHTIYVGAVRALGVDPQRRPLLYHRGRYVDWPGADGASAASA